MNRYLNIKFPLENANALTEDDMNEVYEKPQIEIIQFTSQEIRVSEVIADDDSGWGVIN